MHSELKLEFTIESSYHNNIVSNMFSQPNVFRCIPVVCLVRASSIKNISF